MRAACSAEAVRRLPCRSCPWRLSASAEEIPGFSLELAEQLTGTCGEPGREAPADAAWFACHQSREGAEVPCAGWLAAAGRFHLGVRLAVLQGRLAIAALEPGGGWPALHESYEDVLAKLRHDDQEPAVRR